MLETKYIWPYILKTEYACHHCHKFPPSFNQWDARDSESPFTVLLVHLKDYAIDGARTLL